MFGKDEEEHQKYLEATLARLEEAGLTLNKKKCQFNVRRIEFFGHVFSEHGISPDPEKIRGIKDMKMPNNFKELRSYLGMVNYCGRFIQNISSLTEPLRKLLRQK